MIFIIYFLDSTTLEAREKIDKYNCYFLVEMKSLEFAFEIN